MILFRFASVEIVRSEEAMRCHLVIIVPSRIQPFVNVHLILCSLEQRKDDARKNRDDIGDDREIESYGHSVQPCTSDDERAEPVHSM